MHRTILKGVNFSSVHQRRANRASLGALLNCTSIKAVCKQCGHVKYTDFVPVAVGKFDSSLLTTMNLTQTLPTTNLLDRHGHLLVSFKFCQILLFFFFLFFLLSLKETFVASLFWSCGCHLLVHVHDSCVKNVHDFSCPQHGLGFCDRDSTDFVRGMVVTVPQAPLCNPTCTLCQKLKLFLLTHPQPHPHPLRFFFSFFF